MYVDCTDNFFQNISSCVAVETLINKLYNIKEFKKEDRVEDSIVNEDEFDIAVGFQSFN